MQESRTAALDAFDVTLLAALQADGRLTTLDRANQVGLSASLTT